MLREPDFSLTKKDFTVRWFSGTGPGGQNRNRTKNCCEIIHTESGTRAQSTAHRNRSANQRDAFRTLARRLTPWIKAEMGLDGPSDGRQGEMVRNYHGVRNEVKDHASGLRRAYAQVVEGGDLGEMIEARALSMIERSIR